MDQYSIVIIMNKIASPLNLQTIEKYVKNSKHIDSKDIESPCLPQSKSYLKIIDILYLIENTNILINSSFVESILKSNHIFNNVSIALKPWVIKVLSKLDMVIVWLDIWNVQNSSIAKELINRCFNIGSYIATIKDANMNPGIPQYKNC